MASQCGTKAHFGDKGLEWRFLKVDTPLTGHEGGESHLPCVSSDTAPSSTGPFYIPGCLESVKEAIPARVELSSKTLACNGVGRLRPRDSGACSVLAMGNGISISLFLYPLFAFLP